MLAFSITQISDNSWDVEIDDQFLELFLDSLFSWAKRGAKPEGESKPMYAEDYKDLSSIVTFGKHKGKQWHHVCATDPEYVQWACVNVDKIPQSFKEILQRGLPQAF